MLYKNAVEESTLELLKSIQSKDYLKGFYLVGGTALSLYLGHRKSIDLDLFSNFSLSELLEFYQKKYGQESRMPALKNLIYFDDVDTSDWPVLLKKHDLNWKTVKNET
ncbi:MAG: nucleotidyl transferase AbiEii/AbiGii toxin family protein [Bacteroidales bacterium]|nr:nucleotidyl transferase AbiEii/AbiGii toxin family protein [Bacteroidales bacterium]MCF8343046.1 nucleotidyl transferase AbiEii/AbiGii toxin family protein [Bacteroidales bacterium]MCF8349789.1 nucleotidyl transferase AbiEii/AbiGii toxin family protein [Bacteroidales bacterium]MCF8375909.1 nucleotidyl transferase AbiEii/AbiGii toxin family protein [Bacteroidales bacterium]